MTPKGITLLLTAASATFLAAQDQKSSDPVLAAIAEKYAVGPDVRLSITEAGTEHGLRKIRVSSLSVGHPFQKNLLVSADGKFIVEPVADLSSAEDPKSGELASLLMGQGSPTLGASGAAVIVVVYADFQCGFCREAEKTLRDRIRAGGDRNLRIVFKHFPLESHNWSRSAARSAVCVDHQSTEAFWSFADYVYDHQPEITPANITARVADFLASRKDLDPRRFQECMESSAPDETILRDQNNAYSLGINATPTFLIDGKKIVGMGDRSEFLGLLDRREAMDTSKNEKN